MRTMMLIGMMGLAVGSMAAAETVYSCDGPSHKVRYTLGERPVVTGSLEAATIARARATVSESALGTLVTAGLAPCGDECRAEVTLLLPKITRGESPRHVFASFLVLRERNHPIPSPKPETYVWDKYRAYPTSCRLEQAE